MGVASHEEEGFDEQSFLLDFYEQTVRANPTKNYENFIQLTGDPTGLMNRLQGAGAGAMLDLTTHQIPLLVPKIQLYKVYNVRTTAGKITSTYDKPFYFDDRTTEKSIKGWSDTTRARGSAVALKSFTWNDLGTDPANSGITFVATLKLVFQSFDGVFENRNGVRFADLLVPAKPIAPDQIPKWDSSKSVGEKKQYEDADYQIRAVVGWSTPSDPGGVTGLNPKTIRNTQAAFLLSLTHHDIDLREDGSLEMTINYIAALEGRMLSPKADLLYIEDGKLAEKLSKTRTRLEYAKEAFNDFRAVYNKHKNTKATQNQEAFHMSLVTRPPVGSIFGVDIPDVGWGFKSRGAVSSKEAKKQVENLTSKMDALKNQSRLKSYSRLLREIEEGKTAKGKRRQINWMELTQVQISEYQAMTTVKYEHIKNPSDRSAAIKKYRLHKAGRILKMSADDGKHGFRLKTSPQESHNQLTALTSKLLSSSSDDERQKLVDAAMKKAEKQGIELTYDLNFFYFGDLIDAALKVLYNKKDHPSVDSKKQFRFMLGTIDLWDPEADRLESVPLCDIPISLKMFKIWFLKNIIKPKLDTLDFRTFVQRICSELIGAALSPASYGTQSRASSTRISTSNFLLPKTRRIKDSGRMSLGSLGRNIAAKRRLGFLTTNNYWKATKDLKQYMFLYMGGCVSNVLKGDSTQDEAKNIFHFYVGNQRGIVKKITFKRTDLPLMRETRMAEGEAAAQANLLFSDHYSANISMLGSPIFKPGMLVFIDPVSMGLGSVSSPNSFGNQLGIGGYYLIIKAENIMEGSKFETNLDLISTVPISALATVSRSRRVPGNRTNAGAPYPPQPIETVPARPPEEEPQPEEESVYDDIDYSGFGGS